jgi:hypothetical protein
VPQSQSSQPLEPTVFFPTGVAAFISAVKTVEVSPVSATKQSGHPAAATAGVTATASADPNVVSNGGTLTTIHSTSPFNKVLVAIVNAGAEIEGFWELDLTAATTDQTLLIRFASSLPAAAFDVVFRVVTPAGVVSQVSTVSATVASVVSSLHPQVIASYSPNPAPFLNGVRCTFTGTLGCLWEFQIVLQEFNGVAVSTATLTETYTFQAGEVVTNTTPVLIPAAGTGFLVRMLACGTATTSCVPADELAGGTYTYRIDGTDTNGNAFTFVGPSLVLQGR